ncbi:hypothetical protein P2318_24715 [Myxococcaceae bacterium GXIMD 01537]
MFDNDGWGSQQSIQRLLEPLEHSLRDAQADMVRMADQIRLQRKVIEKLVQVLSDMGAPGEALLKEPEVRELLNLSPEPKPGAGKETGRTVGKLRCRACNSVVDDKEGILDEVCPWCGEQLASST